MRYSEFKVRGSIGSLGLVSVGEGGKEVFVGERGRMGEFGDGYLRRRV